MYMTHIMGMFSDQRCRGKESEQAVKGGSQRKPQVRMENKIQMTTGVSVPSRSLSTRTVIQTCTAEKGKSGANYKTGTFLMSPRNCSRQPHSFKGSLRYRKYFLKIQIPGIISDLLTQNLCGVSCNV